MKDRTLLMIPGPIEFEPAVLQAMGAPTASHVAPNFIEAFGQSIEKMRDVWKSQTGQPFIISGSGTLAMEIAASNLVEAGDKVLVVSTGYFGSRYKDILNGYGAEVTFLQSEPGDIVEYDLIEETLKKDSYKLMTFTHVDTSTAVRMDAKLIGELGRKHNVLSILDGVCSIAGEELYMDDWGIDVALTASQKAIGVPPGLALLVAGPKAMDFWKNRKTAVVNYYADWKNWLPIMEAYEARKPSYFATPPVNLIFALNISLGQILDEGMEKRFERHKKLATALRAGLTALGLKQIPSSENHAAFTLSAPCYPDGVTGAQLLPKIKESGVILAGGLLGEIKNSYFRIGHMGAVNSADVLAVVSAIEIGLSGCGYSFKPGTGIAATQSVFLT